MKKRCLSLLLALVMCLSLLPATALAADRDFTIKDGVLTHYWGDGGDVVIPNGVTSIGDGAFYMTSVTSVSIPDSVTEIGYQAFWDCRDLASVNIGSGVTRIDACAFLYCTSLKSVSIPPSVTSIGETAFSNCTSLESVSIPDSVTSIDGRAFQNCTSLKSVVIPSGVTRVSEGAFQNCAGLESVSIPDSVTEIDHRAFANCTSLESVSIPDSVTSIGPMAFSGCTSLTSVSIPGSVTDMGWRVFEGCTGLKSVSIPDSVSVIESFAFSDCTSLTSVTIPVSVTMVRYAAFNADSGLTDVYYGGTEVQWKAISIDEEDNDYLLNAVIHYSGADPAPAVTFNDVPDWAKEAVDWAVARSITNGTGAGKFSPNDTCTLAHILTFLYRAKGSPAVSTANPFTDVKESDYFCNAAIWAAEQGLVSGNKLNPYAPCTRATVVTYLWKLAGSPATAYDNSFTDVAANADYAQTVAWAVGKGITNGMGAGLFGPGSACNRGQIVTFLYRAYK